MENEQVQQEPTVDAWLKKHTPEIKNIQTMLLTELSDNPSVIVQQLVDIECWGSRASSLLAHSNFLLDLAEKRELSTIDKELKAIEREVALAAAVARERRLRDVLHGICDAIKTRISLGQSIIKLHSLDSMKHHV